jgi:hypothetical protein
MNYNNKKFKIISNSENGELTTDLIFHYHQKGSVLTCEYSGGEIIKGHLLGVVNKVGNIKMSYHQINEAGELKTGVCDSIAVLMPDGKYRLHEAWQWTSGDKSKGTSVLEEV